MTEAMSRREIEDVLTSIKRLVSHEVQSRVPALATSEHPASAESKEKLVLTPSLRVPDTRPPVDDGTIPDPVAQEPGPQVPLPDVGNLVPVDLPDPWPCDQPPAQDAADLPGKHGSLIRRIAQAGLLQDASAANDVGRLESPETETSARDLERDAATDILEPQASDSDIEETLARLEAVLSGQAAPEHGAPQAAAPDLSATSSTSRTDPTGGEQIIDEGMLYQLVAHIVRQELQGELGEKITRNIRKLVRAEVARELQMRRPSS